MFAVERSATIANGESLSGAINLGDCSAILVVMPSTWTAAVLTLQFSADGATFGDVYDKAGAEYTLQAAASRAIILDVADMLGLGLVKIRSGTSGTPVNQGAERIIKVLGRLVS